MGDVYRQTRIEAPCTPVVTWLYAFAPVASNTGTIRWNLEKYANRNKYRYDFRFGPIGGSTSPGEASQTRLVMSRPGHAGVVPVLQTTSLIVLAGAVTGLVSVGVLSRLAMFALVRLNPGARGVTSDDGFEMGRFTLSGSLNLAAVGALLGVLSGILYLALERLAFGPAWFRALSLGLGAGTVAATQVVHADGVDFRLLEPLWLAVGLFLAVPTIHVVLLDLAAVRVRRRLSVPAPSATGALSWLLRLGLAVLFAVAVASLVGDVRALNVE